MSIDWSMWNQVGRIVLIVRVNDRHKKQRHMSTCIVMIEWLWNTDRNDLQTRLCIKRNTGNEAHVQSDWGRHEYVSAVFNRSDETIEIGQTDNQVGINRTDFSWVKKTAMSGKIDNHRSVYIREKQERQKEYSPYPINNHMQRTLAQKRSRTDKMMVLQAIGNMVQHRSGWTVWIWNSWDMTCLTHATHHNETHRHSRTI